MRAARSAIVALLLAGCLGPKPEVESVDVARLEGTVALVTIVLRNRGTGDGQAAVDVTLRARTSRDVVARAELLVELHPRERLRLSRKLRVASAEDLVAEAEARYPP